MWQVVILTALAFYMGNLGYDQRGYYTPGIGNYLHAAISGKSESHSSRRGSHVFDAESNTLDAVAPFTRRVEIRETSGDEPGIEKLPQVLFHINPIPSGIVDPGRIGTGLSDYMRTVGRVGLTSPALADLYYALGYIGLVFVVGLGAAFGYFDRYAVYRPGLVGQLGILLVVIGTGISLHSGIRPWTRPLLYAFIMIVIARYFQRKYSKS